MNKLLPILLTCLSLLGCDSSHAEELPEWNHKLTLVKDFDNYTKLYISENKRCYLRFYRYKEGSVSPVTCEDFGVNVGKHTDKEGKHLTDSHTELLRYIRDYCVVNDEYARFPHIKGDSVLKQLQGKELACKLPENIDNSLNERAEYLRLKDKYGGDQ